MEITKIDTCLECRFFVPEASEPKIGRCHRYPRQRSIAPQQNAVGVLELGESTNYPLQSLNDWCGEFQKAKIPVAAGIS